MQTHNISPSHRSLIKLLASQAVRQHLTEKPNNDQAVKPDESNRALTETSHTG